MIIGNHAVIDREIQCGSLMTGEGVHVSGEITTEDDIRADVWCKFDQNVTVGGDAYLGEFTAIQGKIVVEGDLDIGKEVKLNGGFLSKGWVVVRNPLPVMVFIFLYIRALIGLGKTSEEIDKALSEMFEDDEEIDFENMDEDKMSEIIQRGGFFVIPLGTKISSESINVPEDFIVGNDCTIQTRIICKRFEGGRNMRFCGFIRSKGEALIAEGSDVTGEIFSSGRVIIDKNVRVDGTIHAKTVWIHETARIEGKVLSGNIHFIVGDAFDLKDPENADNAVVLSKADSFDLMETHIAEKKAEETVDAETEDYLEADSAERDAAGKALAAEMEEELAGVAEETAEAEASDSDEENPNGQKKQHENLPIVNVFTGESMETEETSEKEKDVPLRKEESVAEESESSKNIK